MKTLVAIDGSTTVAGYCVYKLYENKTFTIKKSGYIIPKEPEKEKTRRKKGEPKKKQTKKEQKTTRSNKMEYRMNYIIDRIFEIIESEKSLTYIVIEDTYSGKDPNAYKWLCRLQGFLLGYSKVKDVSYSTAYPSHWRKVLGIPTRIGNHFLKREELKAHSLDYIQNVLGYTAITEEDEAEAVLIGRAKLIEMGYTQNDKKANFEQQNNNKGLGA